MFAINDCYLDDSKDKHQEFSYVCAGFYGEMNAWDSFTERWRRQLLEEKIDYFKSSECNSLSDQFARFRSMPEPQGRNEANGIRKRLQKIAVESVGLRGVGIAVPVSEFEAVLRHSGATNIFPKGSIYHRAFEFTLLKTVRLACTKARDLVVFVHDDGPDYGQLHTIFKSFRNKNPKTARHFTTFMPMDDKVTPALQLADMFANSIQGMTVKFMMGEEDASHENIFMFDRSSVGVWTKEMGEIILRGNLKSRNLPVPESLEEAIAAHPSHPIYIPPEKPLERRKGKRKTK